MLVERLDREKAPLCERCIDADAAVPLGEDETVAIRPVGPGWVDPSTSP